MILQLRLRDLGVIADATIELGAGLTAITGETGAGKTMLLTGVGLLLGGRADPAVVRPGADLAAVEGVLVLDGPAREIADEAGAIIEDDEVIVVRTVAAAGRSRAHLGGRSVPAGVLTQIGSEILTIHGQSDQVRLRSAAQQRAALDAFAGPRQRQALSVLAASHAERRELATAFQRWEADAAARAEEIQRLTEALQEIDDIEPTAGESERLRTEAERLDNIELLRSAATQARTALDGDELNPDAAVLAGLDLARRALSAGAELDLELADLSDRISDAIHIINDVVTAAGSYASGLEADPHRLEQIHQRRAALSGLIRRYGQSEDDADDRLVAVLQYAESARARLAELTAPGAGREALLQRLQHAEVAEQDAAARVTQNRTKAAAGLAAKVNTELAGLQMAGARLSVELIPRPDIGAHGAEDVEFQLISHPGAPARPVAKGASGGELSRIMLAIEVALAEVGREDGRLPAFIFDEVDAGVGGRAATEVGRRLALLAQHTQVVVVTHLAQVAAAAQTQLVVSKSADDRGATTTVRQVTGPDREQEIARMLSGEDSTVARQHASELLRGTD
ncbi:MAG: DNA repair protein RecN [Beutenbergiaceae bacterium]